MIGYALDARRQRFADERHFVYSPHQRSGEVYRWDADARDAINGYYMRDLNI